jgi:hypothetical protein
MLYQRSGVETLAGLLGLEQAQHAAENAVGIVIPSGARNLLLTIGQAKADASGTPAPRNYKLHRFSAPC